ncbi:hypothetical protein J4G33_15390 [Actinotalea sp. BY-33]|uniref:Uncharacterized protein n=1 Tax=Actinotalea soli TaxID=2819234 RepID=A0A939RW90_9CELL|nr:hypothetical protein [Actinotalea soli]MBO1753190.1 hypothetical protein [Actinotalea soli]
MGQRRDYAIDKAVTDRAEAEAVCAAVIDVLRPVIRSARIDVFTDSPEKMPDDVRRAEAHLAAAGRDRKRRGSDGRMGLVVRRGDPEWSAVESYAAWSINAELTGADDQDLATFHDCGYSVVAALTDDEVAALRLRLAPIAPVNLLSDIHDRRRSEKRAVRHSRARAWLGR